MEFLPKAHGPEPDANNHPPKWVDVSAQSLLDAAPDAMLIVNQTGEIVVANLQSEKLFGYDHEELIGRSVESLVPQRLRAEHPHHRGYFLGAPRVRPMGAGLESFALRKDATEVPVEISLSPLTNEAGSFIVSAIRDATDRRRTEGLKMLDAVLRETRECEERFGLIADAARLKNAAIVESSDDAIISKNLEGVIASWNTGAQRILGFTEAEAVGQPITFIIPPELREEENKILRQLRVGERIEHFETVRVRKDGSRVNVSLTVSPLRDPAGRIVGASKIARDMSEVKRAQEDLRKAYVEVRQLKEKLQAESDYLQEEVRGIGRYEEIIGRSEALSQVLMKVEQVASTDAVVLITGESGTGKELVARAIHERSQRKDRVMVKVDCAALPATLIESELFGREKGAYTGALTRQIGRFETADGSTLFLDEIGELGVDLQAKLLRVVQDGDFERLGSTKTTHVNVRIIAATHRDLAERVKNGTFREDLFYRLNVFPVHVPPLRERLEDIPLLVAAFLREFEKKMGKKICRVPTRMMDELKRYPWPGNIRELRNVIERAVIVTTGEKLNLQLPRTLSIVSTRTLKEAESLHILSALDKTGWRVKGPEGAAAILGMKPSTLYTTMRRLHIPTRHEKGGIPSFAGRFFSKQDSAKRPPVHVTT